jgi:hypothetical protein
MELESLGRLLLWLGVGLVLVGGLLLVLSRIPVLRHLGRLPGDIRIQGGNFTCFFPLVSMILLSILLTIALNLIARLLNR